MLDLVANKRNLLILSGLVSHKTFVNTSKSGNPYATFMLAQTYEKKGINSVRYFKAMAFNDQVVRHIRNIKHQCIIEVEAHISFSSQDNNLTMMIVIDTIKTLVKFNLPLKDRGGIHIEDYTPNAVLKDDSLLSHTIDEDEMTILEKGMSRLK